MKQEKRHKDIYSISDKICWFYPVCQFKTLFFILALILQLNNLHAQNIQGYAGINHNRFYDMVGDRGHYRSSYEPASGYSIGARYDYIHFNSLKLGFTLQMDEYSGDLIVADGGLGGGHTTDMSITKSIVSLGIFPLNIKILKVIDVNFGLVASALTNESFSGKYYGWISGGSPWSNDLDERNGNYSKYFYAGLQGRIAYNIRLSYFFSIVPQYLYYLGLTNELKYYTSDTKSRRHHLMIGISKKIN